MNETARVLCAIASTNPVYATQFVENIGRSGLPPQLFDLIKTLEDQGLLTTVRSGHDGIISLRLTDLGAERAREAQQEAQR